MRVSTSQTSTYEALVKETELHDSTSISTDNQPENSISKSGNPTITSQQKHMACGLGGDAAESMSGILVHEAGSSSEKCIEQDNATPAIEIKQSSKTKRKKANRKQIKEAAKKEEELLERLLVPDVLRLQEEVANAAHETGDDHTMGSPASGTEETRSCSLLPSTQSALHNHREKEIFGLVAGFKPSSHPLDNAVKITNLFRSRKIQERWFSVYMFTTDETRHMLCEHLQAATKIMYETQELHDRRTALITSAGSDQWWSHSWLENWKAWIRWYNDVTYTITRAAPLVDNYVDIMKCFEAVQPFMARFWDIREGKPSVDESGVEIGRKMQFCIDRINQWHSRWYKLEKKHGQLRYHGTHIISLAQNPPPMVMWDYNWNSVDIQTPGGEQRNSESDPETDSDLEAVPEHATACEESKGQFVERYGAKLKGIQNLVARLDETDFQGDTEQSLIMQLVEMKKDAQKFLNTANSAPEDATSAGLVQ